ncbi:urea transporter [Fulvivirga sedimenti]|uniref:Urea transporter n=1 Tax=Fulvivirga sedimenti TaxID=2879465 RepID=A0A9X1HMA5_9BACT|nr:urea transporter [Fulvivirga sedimenti]MCA6073448.1 urea transporter [Fulvivirga sedimenti]
MKTAELRFWTDSTLRSYSQVFFSLNYWLGGILIFMTFLVPTVGISGLFVVLVSNALARWLGFDMNLIRHGDYSFNSLLVGLGLGTFYELNFPFFILLINAAFITLMLTIVISGILYKYRLPYLSIPFLLSFWLILLASRQFEALGISERGVFLLNELYVIGNTWLVNVYHNVQEWPIHESILIYLKSLGAIFFQFNIISGILCAIGLLIFSRIAFSASLLSFYSAYLFYHFIGAQITDLSYSYIGFNFILSGIAVGAFFLIPSYASYLWSVLLIPAMVIITSSLGNLFASFQLGIYSLPFNMVVLSFIYLMNVRKRTGLPATVPYQWYSPESNLYENRSSKKRYANLGRTEIDLPFFGEWFVSQGHNGEYTHKEYWKHAWDFVMVDENSKSYSGSGKSPADYFCFGKPVLAAADGEVISVEDAVADNDIGNSNTLQNWGNTIVIKHTEYLYSQVSHLQFNSIMVKTGDRVHRGQRLASCGNSGRSPYPHLHFQLQDSPGIGAQTIPYPIGHYLVAGKPSVYKTFETPQFEERISPLLPDEKLLSAFDFSPGKQITVMCDHTKHLWEVGVSAWNQSFISDGISKAYFTNNGIIFQFISFEGKQNSLLFEFFKGLYHVPLIAGRNVTVNDKLPLHLLDHSFARYLSDFIAPFYESRKVLYELKFDQDRKQTGKISLSSSVTLAGWTIRTQQYSTVIENGSIVEMNKETGGTLHLKFT